jgi:hypothetical protein
MESKSGFWDFNKQIAIGEIGSLVGAPITGAFVSLLTKKASFISGSAVAGSLFFASLFWLITRMMDEKKKKQLSAKKMIADIAWYTPVAAVVGIFIYQPILYFLSKRLLESHMLVIFAIILAQLTAFLVFLVLINSYRFMLIKLWHKEL